MAGDWRVPNCGVRVCGIVTCRIVGYKVGDVMIPCPTILGRQIDVWIHAGVLEHVLRYTTPVAFMEERK
jgi:hypothetical protein